MIAQPLRSSRLPFSGRVDAAIAALQTIEAAGKKIATPLGNGSLVWRIWGERNKAELVLLHGGSGSWNHWVENVLPLARSYRVIVPDMPGLGDSDFAPSIQSADDVARAVQTGLDTVLVGNRYHLAGFSFGAMISGHLATLDHRVATLGLVGAVGLGVDRNTDLGLSRSLSQRKQDRWAIQAQNLAILMLHDTKRIDDLAIYLQDYNVRRARLKCSVLSSRETLRSALRGLTIPVAAVWGEQDSIYLGRNFSERNARIASLPRGEVADLINGGGHWIAYEAPAAVNDWLLTWLGRHPLE